MIIDTHLHYLQILRYAYHWLPKTSPVNKAYQLPDIEVLLERHKISGCILVQTINRLDETLDMLALSDQHIFIKGVVGWVDFESPDVEKQLDSLSKHQKFRGVRPMVADIEDINWLLRDDVDRSLSLLGKYRLTLDALVTTKHLPNLLKVLVKHPDLRVVIDHGAKPAIQSGNVKDWKEKIKLIAGETNAVCKYSGLLTEAKKHATLDDLRPCLDWMTEWFGKERIMYGSDWPVLEMCSHYSVWQHMLDVYTESFTSAEKAAFWAGTAQNIYRL